MGRRAAAIGDKGDRVPGMALQAGVPLLAVARPGGCRAAGTGRRPGGRPAIDPAVAGGPVSRVQGHRSLGLGAPNGDKALAWVAFPSYDVSDAVFNAGNI